MTKQERQMNDKTINRIERELLALRQAAKEAAVAMAKHMPNRKETHDLFAVLTGEATPAIAAPLEWRRAPKSTVWGSEMMGALVELDEDSTLDLYCHKDDIHKVAAALSLVLLHDGNDQWEYYPMEGIGMVRRRKTSEQPQPLPDSFTQVS
jgi:hypothetical protein